MKKQLLILFYLISISAVSQEDAWVFFNAKPNAQYYYDNPLEMLSQRALDRRTTQNIALDIKDVPLHQPYVDQITASTGITVMAKSKWLNALHIRGTQANIAALTALSFVDHIQYANHSLNPGGRVAPITGKTQSTNKFLDVQVDYNYGNSSAQIQMLNGHILHQQNHTGAGKIVAIMDAGFPGVNTTAPFQRLRDNGLILGGYDFVNNTTNPYTGYQHGTQVLSNMGGFATNLVGTAPDAQYYLFITEDIGSETPLEESNWVEAAEMADNLGVDVINTSLGYFIYDNAAYTYSYDDMNGAVSVMSRAVDIAFSRGMICVTSAGNDGQSATHPHISTPADAALSLTVGAVNSGEVKAGFSSIGPSFDGRIKPDVMAMGVASVVANQAGAIVTNNGTSFAGPILAGAVTSFWSAFPNKTNAEIVQLVKQSADRYATPDNNYGYGIPDFQLALALSNAEFDLNGVNLFPNPSNSKITVTGLNNLIGSDIIFYNNLGQVVLKKNINNPIQNISLESLSSGIYYYNIASAEKTIKGKIVKN